MKCKSAFKKLIDKNVKVPSTGKNVTTYYRPPADCQHKYALNVYCTEKDKPILVDESCQFVGKLTVSVPKQFTGIWTGLEKYQFGMTEIKVSAIVKAINETFESTLDLLG